MILAVQPLPLPIEGEPAQHHVHQAPTPRQPRPRQRLLLMMPRAGPDRHAPEGIPGAFRPGQPAARGSRACRKPAACQANPDRPPGARRRCLGDLEDLADRRWDGRPDDIRRLLVAGAQAGAAEAGEQLVDAAGMG